MTEFSMIATVVVLVGVTVLILLFERERARRIERDLRDATAVVRAARAAQRGRDTTWRPE